MIVVLLIVAAAVGGYLWFASQEKPSPPVAVVAPTLPSVPVPDPGASQAEREAVEELTSQVIVETPVLPVVRSDGPTVVEERSMQLDQSDDALRPSLAELASQIELGEWLLMRDLIRSFVVAVDNIAEGRTPRAHLAEMEPAERFSVRQEADRFFIDPASYARFDMITDVFVEFDLEAAVEIYVDVYPLIQQAYEELGYPDHSFDETFERAIVELLAVPRLIGPVELEPLVVTYAFADFEIEGLTAAQKQLLRMGPENVVRIQHRLRALGTVLAMNTAEFPPPSKRVPLSFDESNPEAP